MTAELKPCQTCDGRKTFYGETCQACKGTGAAPIAEGEREAFEVAYSEMNHCTPGGGWNDFDAQAYRYHEEDTHDAWVLWQAATRAALASRPAAEVELPPLPTDVMRALSDARSIAMKNVIAARIPESGDFGDIAQHLDWAIGEICRATVAAKPAAREAARQSIESDDDFQDLVGDVYSAGAYNESIEKPLRALIAYIDTWGDAALAAKHIDTN